MSNAVMHTPNHRSRARYICIPIPTFR